MTIMVDRLDRAELPSPGVCFITLRVVGEGLAVVSALVEAVIADLAAAHNGGPTLITEVVPAAADLAPLPGTAALSVRGSEQAAAAILGVEELGRYAVCVGKSGTGYADGDAAASYLITGGRR